MKTFGDIAFTPAVQSLQAQDGSRASYARMQASPAPEELGAAEREFLADADSVYLATVGETGWPYVQHRGGPPGFLRVVGPALVAFADFRGNRQHVSEGNASVNDKASMIVMDYAAQRRLKLLGHLRFVPIDEAEPGIAQAIALPAYRARIERAALFEVVAFDWNCPQHITPRYTLAQIAALRG